MAPPKEKRYSEERIEGLKKHLAQLKPKPRSDISARELVAQLADEIQEAAEKGCSLDDITQAMKSDGIGIAESTLRRYLQDARRKHKPAPKASAAPRRSVTRKADNPAKHPASTPANTSAKPGTFTPIQDPDTL